MCSVSMASASAAAVAAQREAVERKLRPVYDAIDCGNLKLALKSVTAVLQVEGPLV